MTYNPNAIAQKNYPQFRTDYDRIILDITKPDGTPSKGEFLIPSDELFSMTYGELIESSIQAPEAHRIYRKHDARRISAHLIQFSTRLKIVSPPKRNLHGRGETMNY